MASDPSLLGARAPLDFGNVAAYLNAAEAALRAAPDEVRRALSVSRKAWPRTDFVASLSGRLEDAPPGQRWEWRFQFPTDRPVLVERFELGRDCWVGIGVNHHLAAEGRGPLDAWLLVMLGQRVFLSVDNTTDEPIAFESTRLFGYVLDYPSFDGLFRERAS